PLWRTGASLRLMASPFVCSVPPIGAVFPLFFLTTQASPAAPARAVGGPKARPADVARIRKQLGLDRPIWVQYRTFMGRLVHLRSGGNDGADHTTCAAVGPIRFDLGFSYQMRRPVIEIITERAPRTFFL